MDVLMLAWLWGFLLLAGVFFAIEIGVVCQLISSRPRFSLRTLLIGMTLVAVLLGAVVWAVK
jgi:hypothetical protein